MNINRLEVSQIFENLVSDVDLRVEQFIHDNQNDQVQIDEINRVRKEYIQEIRECEAYNLSFLDGKHIRLSNEERIKRFCFLIESFMDPVKSALFSYRLFSTDIYLTNGQIICFQELLKFMPDSIYGPCDMRNYKNYKFAPSLDKLFHENRFGFDVCNFCN